MNNLYDRLLSKDAKLAVIGLGYVGLPIALAFARKIKVVGFDINEKRVDMMRRGEDPSNELDPSEFNGCDIHFTADINDLKDVEFFIVAVPTPIDTQNIPDLAPLLGATRTVGQVLKKGDYVVYESTVYPGCTEEDCVPLLERLSNLRFVEDFKVGYSPERINPGDKEHTLESIVKVSSGCDAGSAEVIARVYELVVKAGVHRAASIKVAEAAKIIENTQRDVNIALINELSIIFNRMGINTYDVLEAAGTKWNFLKFQPGLVGGHCIGVDPYYLTHKAEEAGYYPQVVLAGRRINDGMGRWVAEQLVLELARRGQQIVGAQVLVLGLTFKEDCPDLRNTKVVDVLTGLRDYGLKPHVVDPWVDREEARKEFSLEVESQLPAGRRFDAVLALVPHQQFRQLNEGQWQELLEPGGVLLDLKGIVPRGLAPLRL